MVQIAGFCSAILGYAIRVAKPKTIPKNWMRATYVQVVRSVQPLTPVPDISHVHDNRLSM